MVDFLGIGAQKAGTTWLSQMLSKHPNVQFPGGKEVHFWDQHYKNGYDWYEAIFSGKSPVKKGDITPAYAILPPDKIAEVKHYYPNLPLIFVMRNPVERAWSSALMALSRAEMTFEEASDQWFLDHFHSSGSLKRGDYETCIKNWLAHFPQGQLLLICNKEIAARPRDVLKATAQHIGIDAHFFDSLPQETIQTRIFSSQKHALRPALAAELEKVYAAKRAAFDAYLKELVGIKRV